MRSNDTYLNLLASFAYMGRDKDFTEGFFGAHRSGKANVMVDSGAFTKLNARENRDWLNLDSYCDYMQRWEADCEKYVMLDVIGNQVETRKNYETMVDRGLAPMFVLTMYDNDWLYLNSTIKVNPDCCVAGGTMTKGPWIIKRFQDARKHTENTIRIHALGYVTFPNIIRAPIVSGDSSTWIQGAQKYGQICVFNKGLSNRTYHDYLGGAKMKPELKGILNRLEITPQEFVKKSNHRGNMSIGTLLSMVAFIDYQRYVWKYGKRLFLAVNSKGNLDKILWVDENYRNLTYQKYLQEFGK